MPRAILFQNGCQTAVDNRPAKLRATTQGSTMHKLIVAGAAIALFTGSAYAGGRGNDYQLTRPVNTTAIAGAAAAAKASAVARQAQRQSQRQSQFAKGGSVRNSGNSSSRSSASVSNSGNSTVSFKDVRQAPGFGLGGGSHTAPCQSYTELAASFPGGGFGFGTGRTVKFCKAMVMSEWLEKRGYRRAAVQLMVNEEPMIRRVLSTPKKP